MKLITNLRFPRWSVPLALLAITLLAYAVLARNQGFYWDDWAFAWIGRTFGMEGFARYFSTNRPLRTYFYGLFFPLLGIQPFAWQVFSIILRWLTAVSLWWALTLAWPRAKTQMTWVTLLFVVYPGFTQQVIAVNYGNFFFVQTLFHVSLALTVMAIRGTQRLPLTLAALLLSALNLFTLEYFVGLEVLRVVFIWLVTAAETPRTRLLRTLRTWAPYAALLGVYLFWRVFIFGFILYKPDLVTEATAAPAQTLLSLPLTVMHDIATAGLTVWLMALRLPDIETFGRASTLVYAALTLGGSALTTLYLARLASDDSPPDADSRRARANTWLWLGLFAMLMAGGIFWVLKLIIRPEFPNDRFLLPFALGAAFFIVGLVERFARPAWLRVVVVGLLVGFGIGQQFQYGNAYRREWELQSNFFWQFTWRAPELRPGTLIVSYESPFTFYTDNSLTAPFNWIYAPENTTPRMDVMYYYLTVRLPQGRPLTQPAQPIEQDYLAAAFSGSTSQMLVIDFNPPACLRIYDPVADLGIPMLPGDLRDAQPLSNLSQIITNPPTPALPVPEYIFGPEPKHGWCYYYQKADLARQRRDWAEVARLGDLALALDDNPNEASERVVFIEGYARIGRWDDAIALTREARAITPLMQPMLCTAWQRIAEDGGDPLVVSAIRNELECQP